MFKFFAILLTILLLGGIGVFLYLGLESRPASVEVAAPDIAAAPEDAGARPVEPVSPEEVRRLMGGGGKFVLLDVRTKEEHDRVRIPGSKLLPIDKVEIFGPKVERLIPDKDTEVAVFCRSGRRSDSAAAIMLARGYRHVRNMGGIIDWPYDLMGTADF